MKKSLSRTFALVMTAAMALSQNPVFSNSSMLHKALFALTASAASDNTPTAKKLGDVSCDGELTVSDAVMLARIIANDKKVAPTEEGRLNGDVNCNGTIEPADLTKLLKALADGLTEIESPVKNPAPETDNDSKSDTDTDTDSKSDTDTDTDSKSETDTDTDTKSGTDTDTDSKSETDTDSKSDTDTDSKSGTDTDTDTKSGTDTDTDSKSETDTDTDSKPASGKPAFIDGESNWYFGNTKKYFGNIHHLSDEYRSKLESILTHTEMDKVNELLGNTFQGACYGMAVTSILYCNTYLNPGDYQANAKVLSDIKVPQENVTSLIEYYFALQKTDVVEQLMIDATHMTEETKIKKLLDELKDNTPTMISYYYGGKGHAVVGYGVEHGEYKMDGYTYDVKILVYDSDIFREIENPNDFCMYINTQTNSWMIPKIKTQGGTTMNGATLNLTSNDLEILNYKGCLNGTTQKPVENYVPVMHSQPIASAFSITSAQTNIASQILYALAGDSDDIMIPVIGGSKDATTVLDTPEAIDMDMDYRSDLFRAKHGSAKKVTFNPSGFVQVTGTQQDAYELSCISNEGFMPTDWYKVTVSGQAADVKLAKQENGYLITADNLNNVTVTAKNGTVSATCSFSANYKSALIYEIDENTIGIMVDADGDGVCETEIANN